MHRIVVLMLVGLPLLMTGCAEKQAPVPGVKIGKPYQIYGTWYRPAFQPQYDEEGIASWYGPGFHGNYTASGERFDKYDMTAAHTTLPMPSIVRVTNLDNGKSAVVRINDRGPFKDNRIIDLSKKAADAIDMIKTGTARVRVQYLHEETERYLVENNIKGREKVIGSEDTRNLNRKAMERLNQETQPVEMADNASSDPVVERPVEQADPFALKVASGEQPQSDQEESTVRERDVSPAQAPDSQSGSLREAFDHVSSSQAADRPAAQAKPFTPPKRLPPAETTSPEAFFIQVGTFSSKENVERLTKKIEPVGDVETTQVTSGERTLYRVRLGSFVSREAGEEALSKLVEMGISDARIVKQK